MVVRYRNYKEIPGIYKWENRINHKCYIGQSIDLNKRLAHHFSNIKNNRYDNPLYRAIKKYGLENFDVTIIEVLEASDDLKSKLDEREVYYIQKYNSYGKNGYNQTLGGDGGILGYKFTDEQREHVAKNSTKVAEEKSRRVYMYNIKTNYIQMWIDVKHAAEHLKINRATIRKACLDQIHLIKEEWVLGYSEEDVKDRAKDVWKRKNPGNFQRQYYGTFVYKGNKFTGGVNDAAEYFKISKSYLYGICNKSRKSNVLLFIPN